MRIHFSSKKDCFLRLSGVLMGHCGEIEKFVDIEDNTETLVEFLPADGNFLPIIFVINATFFQSPPKCCNVYLYEVGADIIATTFQPRSSDLQVLQQKRVGKMLATLLQQQYVHLHLENQTTFESYPLPFAQEYYLEDIPLSGQNLLLLTYTQPEEKKLYLFNQSCKLLLESLYTSYSITDSLQISLQHQDLARHLLQQKYEIVDQSIQLKEQTLTPHEQFSITNLHEKILPFAFFQTILLGGNLKEFLAPALQDKENLLKEYLGNFIAVQIPKDIIYHHYGEINCVGIVYAKTDNLYTVKFFVTDIENGKICNLRPLQAQ